MLKSRIIALLTLAVFWPLSACSTSNDQAALPGRPTDSARIQPIPSNWVTAEELAGTHALTHRTQDRTEFLKGHGHEVKLDGTSRVAYFDGKLMILDDVPRQDRGRVYYSPQVTEKVASLLKEKQPKQTRPRVADLPKARALAGKTFVIDAGHGGKDSGTHRSGHLEKSIVLKVARLVSKQLRSQGAKVVMTRNNDKFISFDGRVAISNRTRPDAFVSIHVNAANNLKAAGAEIFRPIRRERGQVASKLSRSTRLANAIYKRLSRVTPGKDRGVKPNSGNFRVVRRTRHPAVLVEMGFISNAAERSLLITHAYQQRLARAIAAGIRDHILGGPHS